jgi:hypothetical protein
MNTTSDQAIIAAVESAVSRLARVEHFRGGTIVSMPMMYPSGSSVVLEIIENSGRCLVSDRGGAFSEAEMYGASRVFRKEAERAAEAADIRFDGRNMFVVDVSLDQLRGAMVVVANCSSKAASATALRHSERADRDAKEELYHRLASLYRSRDVQHDVQMRGARAGWRVSVAVFGGPSLVIFEPVNGVYVSAVGTAAKFQDFAQSENPPKRIGVIRSAEDLGDFYGLVANASSRLISTNSSDSEFLEAA